MDSFYGFGSGTYVPLPSFLVASLCGLIILVVLQSPAFLIAAAVRVLTRQLISVGGFFFALKWECGQADEMFVR
jgi:hypothetical protein